MHFVYSVTRQVIYVWRNIEACSRNHCFRGKVISIKYCDCVFVALVVYHENRMRHVMLPCAACLALTTFSHISS
jgi:hypothetical protein